MTVGSDVKEKDFDRSHECGGNTLLRLARVKAQAFLWLFVKHTRFVGKLFRFEPCYSQLSTESRTSLCCSKALMKNCLSS